MSTMTAMRVQPSSHWKRITPTRYCRSSRTGDVNDFFEFCRIQSRTHEAVLSICVENAGDSIEAKKHQIPQRDPRDRRKVCLRRSRNKRLMCSKALQTVLSSVTISPTSLQALLLPSRYKAVAQHQSSLPTKNTSTRFCHLSCKYPDKPTNNQTSAPAPFQRNQTRLSII